MRSDGSVCGVGACSLRVSPLHSRFLSALFIQALHNFTTVASETDTQRKKTIYKIRMIKNEQISMKTQHLTGRGRVEVSAQRSKWRVEKVKGHLGQSYLLLSAWT